MQFAMLRMRPNDVELPGPVAGCLPPCAPAVTVMVCEVFHLAVVKLSAAVGVTLAADVSLTETVTFTVASWGRGLGLANDARSGSGLSEGWWAGRRGLCHNAMGRARPKHQAGTA